MEQHQVFCCYYLSNIFNNLILWYNMATERQEGIIQFAQNKNMVVRLLNMFSAAEHILLNKYERVGFVIGKNEILLRILRRRSYSERT